MVDVDVCRPLSEDDDDDGGSVRDEELANSYSVRCGDGCGDETTSGTGLVGDRDGFTNDAHLKEDCRVTGLLSASVCRDVSGEEEKNMRGRYSPVLIVTLANY